MKKKLRKLEIQVFPETTESPRYHALSLWQIMGILLAVVGAVIGVLTISPLVILKKWTDVSLFKLYAENKELQKTLNQMRAEEVQAKQRLSTNDSLRKLVVEDAGLGRELQRSSASQQLPEEEHGLLAGAIGPARNMNRIRAAHTTFKEFLDALKKNPGYARTLPIMYPLKHHDMVTGRFSLVQDKHTGEELPHRGIDYATFEGDTVMAPGAGMVASINSDKGFGICMTIVHNERTETFYGHLLGALVKPGQTVTRGEPIALVGKTGRAAGPHLHYEVHVMGQPVNPEDYYLTP